MDVINYLFRRVSLHEYSIGLVVPYLREAVNSMPKDNFTNPEYYPPENTKNEDVLRYFIFMVAIDHRTSRNKPYEAYVNSRFYHGADLLYKLGSKKFAEDLNFFSPERMAKISDDEVREWLSVKGVNDVSIWDPEVRVELLRDLGRGLIKWFEGSVTKLIDKSGGYLKSRPQGLIYLMKRFKAYSDPVEKKIYLFVKFIERRGLINIVDEWNKEVPVDNHLTRIALRLGIVTPEEDLLKKIKKKEAFTRSEDLILRLAVRSAYKILSRIAYLDPFILDDFLWYFGRKVCTREKPACVSGRECPLLKVCPSKENPEEIVEHYYVNTYYY
ncbi:MAG: queuosine salvage family protein [Desulfurococcaceae archaeon TW002]